MYFILDTNWVGTYTHLRTNNTPHGTEIFDVFSKVFVSKCLWKKILPIDYQSCFQNSAKNDFNDYKIEKNL